MELLEAKIQTSQAPLFLDGKPVTVSQALIEQSAKLLTLERTLVELSYKVESLSDNVLASRLQDDVKSKDSGNVDDELEGLNIKCRSLDSKIASLLDLVKVVLAKEELAEKVLAGRGR